ncbi:MAG TPA: hypothetical protein PKK06_12960 [Phycisphaerae bacterium]|nr:hypothetical protein [Phycisphaerae bacterium]HNU44390.1 hypothetical protein [Phycisphaerae bacterium]
MGRHSSSTGRGRGDTPSLTTRPESTGEDERPFAEIRKTLNDALRIVSLHRWAFFLPFCVVASAISVLSLYYPRLYTASAGFQRRDDPIVHSLPTTERTGSFTYFRSTLNRDIVSTEYLGDVADALGYTKDLPRNPDGTFTEAGTKARSTIARSLASGVSVSTVSPSPHIDLVTITYVGPNQAHAKPLVEQIRRTYIRRTMDRVRQFLESQREYFQREADEACEQLKEAQRAETRMRLENPLANPQDPGAITLKLSQLEIERRDLQLRRRMAEASLLAQQQLLAALDPPTAAGSPHQATAQHVPLNPQTAAIAQQIHAIDAQIKQFQTVQGMTREHPEVVELLSRRRWLEGQLGNEASGGEPVGPPAELAVNDALDLPPTVTAPVERKVNVWDAEQARLRIQLEALGNQVRDIDISLESNATALAQMEQAKQDVLRRQEEFTEVVTAVAAARARFNQQQATLATLEPGLRAVEQGRLLQFTEEPSPSGPAYPSSPKASTVVFLALVAGAVAGAVFVVLAEVFDHAFRSSSRAARSLGLPILESIDEIVTAVDRRRRLIQRTVVVPLLLIIGVGTVGATTSLAYCSIARPWVYERVVRLPRAAAKAVSELGKAAAPQTVHAAPSEAR